MRRQFASALKSLAFQYLTKLGSLPFPPAYLQCEPMDSQRQQVLGLTLLALLILLFVLLRRVWGGI
jgi:hypothetical protein